MNQIVQETYTTAASKAPILEKSDYFAVLKEKRRSLLLARQMEEKRRRYEKLNALLSPVKQDFFY